MKKIAECRVGALVPDYLRYGTPTVFVTEKEKYNGIYYAYCDICGGMFKFNRWYRRTSLICPCCGRKHMGIGREIMFTSYAGSVLPYRTRMTVIDFKDKIEVRLVYDGLRFDCEKETITWHKVKEVFAFNIKEGCAYWKQIIDKQIVAEKEIGYYADMDDMWQKTVLSFLHYRRITKKGSFAALLRELRDCVNRHMTKKGYARKSCYIRGSENHRLYGSILAIARKVRFWDAPTMPYNGIKGMSFQDWKAYRLKEQYLPENWEFRAEQVMKKECLSYQQAVLQVLRLPNTPFVRRNLTYESIFAFMQAYSLPTLAMANEASKTFVEMELQIGRRNRYWNIGTYKEKVMQICKFVRIFYAQYQSVLTWKRIAGKIDLYIDTLRLWECADKITKREFYKADVSLSHLHDWLSIAIARQADREVVFNISEELKKSLRRNIDGYDFKCIERKSELKNAAIELKNCSAGYARRIGSHVQIVVVANKEGKLTAMLEVREHTICQAKLFANNEVYKNVAVNKACIVYARSAGLTCNTCDIEAMD